MMFSRPHILLADEDAKSQADFRSFFELRGWKFEVVTDVQRLEKALEKSVYDIIIADATMPGLGPSVLLGEMFRTRPSQMLILVDETAAPNEELKLLRSGITDILMKPVNFSWLERCIEQASCFKRLEEREKRTYKFVTSERTEMRFSCRQLKEIQGISLPIVSRLEGSSRLEHTEALKIRLAVQEAVLNALEHGNLELESKWKEELLHDGTDRFSIVRNERMADPNYANKTVTLTSWFDEKSLEIVVKDEGKGFLNSRAAFVPQSENLSCSGRGMTLMTSAVDEVRFSENGSEVTLIKYLRAHGDA